MWSVQLPAPAAEYWPSAQAVHASSPAVAYLPAAQSLHEPPAVDVLPAAQFVHEVAPASDDVPAAQLLQVVSEPVNTLVPAAHAKEAYCPAVQLEQSVN